MEVDMSQKTVEVRVKRQDATGLAPYWETFQVPYRPNMNVITLLQEIQRNPVNTDNKQVAPVVWECSCLEEVCGACTMVINGKVAQSCSALVDRYEQPIVLEPMRKFPVIRDLQVERRRMFESLKQTRAWIEIDGTYDLGPAPRQSPKEQEDLYIFSRCMTCGCCVDACPQYTLDNEFVGPAALGQVYYFNRNKAGAFNKDERLHALMSEGGIHECGNAQNCVRVCPKDIPLTRAIAQLNGDTLKQAIKDLFTR